MGGNIEGVLQVKNTTKNDFGEKISTYIDYKTLNGFLDFVSGDSSYRNNYKGKLEETTHVFICDYVNLNINQSECRLVIDNKIYDVLLIDNPMNLNHHLEILLKLNEVNVKNDSI